jgi:hypothetical protein
VPTKALNQAVKRNDKRFPEDFMFQLEKTEKDELVTICDRFANWKHSSTCPYAFTENGRRSIGKLRAKKLAEVFKVDYRSFL